MFVQIPVAQWESLQAILMDECATETSEETPELIEREGILVVRATPLRDLRSTVRDHGQQILSKTWVHLRTLCPHTLQTVIISKTGLTQN